MKTKAKKARGDSDTVKSARARRQRPLLTRKLADRLDATLVEMAAKSEQGWDTEYRFETPAMDRLTARNRKK